jgi:hypothetical protein
MLRGMINSHGRFYWLPTETRLGIVASSRNIPNVEHNDLVALGRISVRGIGVRRMSVQARSLLPLDLQCRLHDPIFSHKCPAGCSHESMQD